MKKWISVLLLISMLTVTGCSDSDVDVYVENYPADDIYYDYDEYAGEMTVSDLGITQDQLWHYDSFAVWEPATEYVNQYTAIDGDDYRAEVYSSAYEDIIMLRVGDTGFFRIVESGGEVVEEFYCPVDCSDHLMTLGDGVLDFTMNTDGMVLIDEDTEEWFFETVSDPSMGLTMPGMTVTVDKDTCGISHIVNYYDNDVKVAPLDYYLYDVDEFEYADYYDGNVDGIIDDYLTSLLFTGYLN